jgi:translation initiation factor 1
MRKPTRGGLVYSTESGRMCPACRQAVAACICNAAQGNIGRGDGVVRVGRESKRRGGKVVTLVRGLPLDAAGLAELAKRLRAACGAGGTLKDGVIEIQGDHVERAIDWLQAQAQAWVVKRSGGSAA